MSRWKISASPFLVASVAAIGVMSCVEKNAYLELSLGFPPDPRAASAPGGARYAVVRVNSCDVPFDGDWQSSDPLSPVRLSGATATSQPISVEGTPDTETKAIRVKIRFCVDPSCAGINDDKAPELRYEIERAFYLGKRTSLAITVACIPNVPTETDAPPACDLMDNATKPIGKCEVGGCREGVTTSYCAGGKHFCED